MPELFDEETTISKNVVADVMNASRNKYLVGCFDTKVECQDSVVLLLYLCAYRGGISLQIPWPFQLRKFSFSLIKSHFLMSDFWLLHIMFDHIKKNKTTFLYSVSALLHVHSQTVLFKSYVTHEYGYIF